MNEVQSAIGFNIICFAITFVIATIMYDGTIKEKIMFMMGEALFMALLTVGVLLMRG